MDIAMHQLIHHWDSFVSTQRYYEKLMDRGDWIDVSSIPEQVQKQDFYTRRKSSRMREITSLPNNNIPFNYDTFQDWDFIIRRPGGGKKYQGRKISPLTPSRIQLLNDIAFVWDNKVAIWEERYQELIEFQKRYNCTRIPSRRYPTLDEFVRKIRSE